MNTGDDYLLKKNLKGKRPPKRWFGLGLIVLGIILLGSSGGYYAYAQMARSNLKNLDYNGPQPTVPANGNNSGNGVTVNTGGTPDASGNSQNGGAVYIPASRFSTIYPGQSVNPTYWDSPNWAEAYRPAGWNLIKNFQPMSAQNASAVGTLSDATRIQIPAINVDATVNNLKVVQVNGAAAWETPNHIVGHIPTTPNPGEAGLGYYFAHLNSPIKGEGNIFIQLPEIPNLLKQGQDVYVILTDAKGDQYLYKVYKTVVVPQDQLQIETSSDAEINMVACVPNFVYDHRLVVTAKLTGYLPASAAGNNATSTSTTAGVGTSS